MKKPTIITNDPKKMREVFLNQPRVSREHAIRSILLQNGKTVPDEIPKDGPVFVGGEHEIWIR